MLWRSCTLLNLMQGIISTLCNQNSCVPFDFVGDLVGFLLLFLCIQLLYTNSSLTEHDDHLSLQCHWHHHPVFIEVWITIISLAHKACLYGTLFESTF